MLQSFNLMRSIKLIVYFVICFQEDMYKAYIAIPSKYFSNPLMKKKTEKGSESIIYDTSLFSARVAVDRNLMPTGPKLFVDQHLIESEKYGILDVNRVAPVHMSINDIMTRVNNNSSLIMTHNIIENKHIVLQNDNESGTNTNEIYITELELKRIWAEASILPFGKSVGSYTIEEALLLIPDHDDTEESYFVEDSIDESTDSSNLIEQDVQNVELYITTQVINFIFVKLNNILYF